MMKVKLRELSFNEIKEISERKGVKKIAVENFLSTMGDDYWTALYNLEWDRKRYKWDKRTVEAIWDGIQLAKIGK